MMGPPTSPKGNGRVLVTGASGFIGYHCLAPLVARGFEVHAVHSRSEPDPVPGVTWARADLSNQAEVLDLLSRVRADHLLHAAWYVEPGSLISSIENMRWVSASVDLIRAFREAGGQRCVIVGSCYEYDWRYGYCEESLTPRVPDTFYGAAKNGLQEAFRGYCMATGLAGAWGRLFFLYGPRENRRRLVPSVALSLLRGELARSSHGTQIRDYIHVQDAADGLVALLASSAEGAFNIASGQAVTIRTIVEKIGHFSGRAELLEIGAIAARNNDAPLVVADVGKARRSLAGPLP